MFVPADPIVTAIVVVGVFVYFAFKGGGRTKKKDDSNQDFIKWLREREIERSPENVRYQNWLYDHREK